MTAALTLTLGCAEIPAMDRVRLVRALRAFDAGPHPYAHVDMTLATRLGGAIYLVGIVYAASVLPLSPPTGTLAVAGTALSLLASAVIGLALLRRPEPISPVDLLLICYLGLFIAVAFRTTAGAATPFHQLLFLTAMYACAVHPARRALCVLLALTLATLSPLAYETVPSEFAAVTTGHLALTWSLGAIISLWTTRLRRERGEALVARAEAEERARVDVLTALGNRRSLEEALPKAVAAARRARAPFSVLVTDLDGFKYINDTFGHNAGDEMLRDGARVFTSAVRVPDPCYRLGGDEFVALLPGATLAEAHEIAQRVMEMVSAGCVRPDGRPLRMTVGAAELRPSETGADVLARADAALLELKGASRVAG